jgi:cell division protein FtsB
MMKLSYRDKVIAIVLIVILVIVAGFIVVVKPMIDKTNAAQKELEKVQQEKEAVEEKIATLENIKAGIKNDLGSIDEYQQLFFTEDYGFEMERTIRDYCEEVGLTVKSLSFSSQSVQLAPARYVSSPYWLAYQMKIDADLYSQLPSAVYDLWNKTVYKSGASQVVGSTNYSITFADIATWEDLMPLIDRVSAHEKAIYIPSYDLNEDSKANLDRELSFTVYHIVPMVVAQVQAAEDNNGVLPTDEAAAPVPTDEPAA